MRRALMGGLLLFFLIGSGHALEEPEGRVILTVSGNITATNAGNEALFDRGMLEALEQHTTRTHTPWHDGLATFTGPLGRDVLEKVGAQGTMLRVTALNDYAANVPVADFMEYDVLLAMTLDGAPLRVRDQGPLFIIYPFDEFPELLTEKVMTRSVWQVVHIDVLPE
ncbi:molybdopterin-dependent oxidoreductase [Billgrantia bachuensis]|uniref:Molybdopterin-dependent oxidoreductase n=1 Tax=Billgrantia bachuensis TaxID=2717286 RepID=A0ABX0PQT0_9GAMM|nr:molybdopterin-dependent oxidoreductase [Halomonas bachuensis]NIC04577.1 molybdopterin-dependent oxidoreductase [Halomonas bachuensis]